MSDVKRYRLDPESFAQEHPQGDLVDYQDYARLKAEVERLNAVIESHKDAGLRLLAMLAEERRNASHIQAEVERLRKAGDALADAIYEANQEKLEAHKKFKLTDKEYNAVQLWRAAKEGKQS